MSVVKTLLVAIVGIISAIYLLNPGFGIFELIPDAVPVIGNLDEAAATVLLINCLAFFGLDLRHLLQRKPPEKAAAQPTITAGKLSGR